MASKDSHQDLFWALRGGAGGNFGLSTAFQFEIKKVSDIELSVFHKQYETRKPKDMAAFMQLLMHRCEEMGNGIGTRLSVKYLKDPQGERFNLDFVGQWVGEPAQLAKFFQELDSKISPNTLIEYRGPYWQANKFLEEPDESYFYQERSTFISTLPDLPVLEGAMEKLTGRPDVHGPCDIRFFQTGGAVNETAPTATAFVHRSSQWLGLIGYYWEKQDESKPELIAQGHRWQDDFYAYLLDTFHGKGAFQNFPDPSLQDWKQAYYGENLVRLEAIKQKYDPDRLFDYPQAV